MPEDGFANAVAHEATADQVAIMAAVQRPISVNCIQEKAPAPAWKTKPSWFFLAEKDRMIHPDTQQFMAERMKADIRAHQVDHTPMHTAPGLVVQIILEAAQSAAVSHGAAS
jgi:pimeloyl-ACP methyl ester carboxylesterase